MLSIDFIPPVIAHRGAAGYAPENTMAAFIKAKQLGVNWVEFDVQLTADQQIVVFHDKTLDRTSSGRGDLSRYTYAELLEFDAGAWYQPIFAGERIPLFRDVITFIRNENMAANIELKPAVGQEAFLVKQVLSELSPLFMPHTRILFSSFSISALECLRKQSAHCLLGLLMEEWLVDWGAICAMLQCVSVHTNHQHLDPQRVQSIKARSKKVLCYTVNSLSRAKELFSWGVDAIFSDYPDKMLVNGVGDTPT